MDQSCRSRDRKNLAKSAEEMFYDEMAKDLKPEIEKTLKETLS